MASLDPQLPARFADLKLEIASSYGPDFESCITRAWGEIIEELDKATTKIADEGTEIIPQVSLSELDSLTPSQLDNIKKRGCVVIKDVVPDTEAAGWKTELQQFAKDNPTCPGFPPTDKQFFYIYWSKPQVEARSHPGVLKASAWLNGLYHIKGSKQLQGVDLKTPLTYADRYRIRKPGGLWEAHPPHVDGGSIERWEDETFRTCFEAILRGDWRTHDPYDLDGRIKARSSMYGRPNQASIFRTYQGWLAMRQPETGPHQGTIRFFPDVLLSNAYMILRPFFRPKATPASDDPLAAENWEYDLSSPDFPGIYALRDGKGYTGPRPNTETHPHFRLEKTMTAVPNVKPGDMVFWHCDLVHDVEREHEGIHDSAVMYIPAVPTTVQNLEYLTRQRDTFERGVTPPDFPLADPEATYIGVGRPEHIQGDLGRHAMGYSVSAAA
ncbi:hypothetical protein K488DRAFT_78436 [Vararia minispora EC-137]|uniref:Uncharacterized protein n=1 Tax=Vararia minispora EC-137 TaxID=1314806 RepID=A0ACB8QLI7_9AGAM|nr:hypothetical protein K488DRAFT_78436 [Vararia minispora EC-137]